MRFNFAKKPFIIREFIKNILKDSLKKPLNIRYTLILMESFQNHLLPLTDNYLTFPFPCYNGFFNVVTPQ